MQVRMTNAQIKALGRVRAVRLEALQKKADGLRFKIERGFLRGQKHLAALLEMEEEITALSKPLEVKEDEIEPEEHEYRCPHCGHVDDEESLTIPDGVKEPQFKTVECSQCHRGYPNPNYRPETEVK